VLGSLLEVWHTTTPGKADFKGSASEVRAATPSRVILMRTHEERILRILGKAVEPLFTSEITERLNHELGGKERYTMSEISTRLQGSREQVTQLTDRRWMLKRRTDQ
jgi:hypothetical protein